MTFFSFFVGVAAGVYIAKNYNLDEAHKRLKTKFPAYAKFIKDFTQIENDLKHSNKNMKQPSGTKDD